MKDGSIEVSGCGRLRKEGRTGAKKRENGTPRLRAKDQSCRDVAARIAIVHAVKLINRTVAMISEAARLLVAS
jgi:hypothetical protein